MANTPNEIRELIAGKIFSLSNKYFQISDEIFDNPELGYEEVFASELLINSLEEVGFKTERGVGGLDTAFRAEYTNGDGPKLGLLCEYDALPSIGHACGHHMQGPSIILCAQAIKEVVRDLPYSIVVYGTPAEELLTAKQEMWDNGCFRDLDIALMMHASTSTAVDEKSLANISYTVNFKGVSSHAAMNPDKGRSALDALLLSFHALEFLREHVRPDVRMHYTVLQSPGPANIVPAEASGLFMLRSVSKTYLLELEHRLEEIIHGASLMTGTSYDIDRSIIIPNKIPVYKLNDLVMKNAVLAEAPGISPPRDITGTTDFAALMYHIPGCCLRIKFVDTPIVSHSVEFAAKGKSDKAHEAIRLGALILALTCLDLIHDPELIDGIQKEFVHNKKSMG